MTLECVPLGEDMTLECVPLGEVIGECKIGNVTCSVKKTGAEDGVIIYLTEKGSDLPISGTQIMVQKDRLGAMVVHSK